MSVERFDQKQSNRNSTVNNFSKYESLVKSRTIHSREIIIWFRNNDEFDTKKYFWCNETMSKKLGLYRNEDGLILTKDYYDLFVMDAEGKSFIEELKKASEKVRNTEENIYESYVVKLKNKLTSELIYLHFILEVFERHEDGSIKTWGGNGIDVTDVYSNEKQSYVIKDIGSIEYNIISNELSNGIRKVELNPIESRFFLLLVDSREKVVTFERMMKYMDYESISIMMDFAKVYVHRIRKKLAFLGCRDVKIVSFYSKGYALKTYVDNYFEERT